MPTDEILNTLVKLAAAGTSGICVLSIAACGWIMLRLPKDTPPAKHASLRFYMGMCIAIAVLSAATTFGAGYWDYKKVAALKSEKQQLNLTLTNTVRENMTLTNQVAAVSHENMELAETAAKAKADAETVTELAADLSQKNLELNRELDVVKTEAAEFKAIGLEPAQILFLKNDLKSMQTRLSALRTENTELKKELNKNPTLAPPPINPRITPVR